MFVVQRYGSIIYHNYLKATSSIDRYKKQLERVHVENWFLNSRAKALKAEKHKLHVILVSMGKSKQGKIGIITLLKKNDDRIKFIELLDDLGHPNYSINA